MSQQSPKKLSDDEMFEKLAQFRVDRQHIMSLTSKIQQVKLEQLEALKEHYQIGLGAELGAHEVSLELASSKSKFEVYDGSSKRLDEMENKAATKIRVLNDKIAVLQSRLDQFRSLDPEILSEYRRLKDDIECQQWLLEINEDNNTRQERQAIGSKLKMGPTC